MREQLDAGEQAGLLEKDSSKSEGSDEASEKKGRGVTQAETLLKLVKETGASFFHSDTKDLYATIPVAQHTEVWPLDGKDFSTWLQRLYYLETEKPPNNDSVSQAVGVLSARARFECSEPVALSTRVAERDGSFWYDLTNSDWQAIKVSADGWKVVDNPPIMFTRYRHQAAQVTPVPGGDIRKALRHVNLKDQSTLFLCWLASCFIPGIPHTMPIFYGEKGAAKTTTCSLLKALIDPSALDTMTLQNDQRTLAVNLQQHWFLPFDNISFINEEISDTLCRAITGGGIQQRKLFTNADDSIFTFKRCLAINGINNVATRPDLLDRSILVELERISETDRRELADIQAAFEADRPAILGGILDTLAQAMAIFPSVKLEKLPRMADFARWGYAIGEALGGLGDAFLDQYAENRDSQNIEAINNDPVALLTVEFMRARGNWEGMVSELYSELIAIATDHNINVRNKAFPSDPTRLSKRLNGIRSNLEAAGITFKKTRSNRGVSVFLYNCNLDTPAALAAQPYSRNGFKSVAQTQPATPENSSYTAATPPNPLQRNDYVSGVANAAKQATLRGVL